ncbi:class II aldolase/adducin family protein [Novosphingobium sp. AP12]|uniref:class II aldolase/adducin family protein n=1 Tax=Novosphingobium sp. AP12 TaxID=1144305 RepID=UPI000271F626|nr:class II aldolase/adducin family protein [Novosphingobium sp. AP12]EJL28899.1 ribulose-5-phosphate 4-epimerase-like epimerase or aldolase [Novosphingobium sp. AP12]
MTDTTDLELAETIAQVKGDATHAFTFLKESGTLTASLIFNIAHRVPGRDVLLSVRFPSPWSRGTEVTVTASRFSDHKESVLNEERLGADTLIHAHTPHLAAWSLAHKPFPILYVAAQRHLLAREIPNHLERRVSVLETIRARLDTYPDLAPPPGLLESNGGANFWGKGIVETAQLILLIEESARLQAIAAQIGGAQVYTEGALDLQWKRTGLLEKGRSFAREFAPA